MASTHCFSCKPCSTVRPTSRCVSARVARPSARCTPEPEHFDPTLLASLALFGPLLEASPAAAKGGELGLLEGRTLALVHPAIMLFLFGATFYSGWLGWQWRQTRTIGDKIKDLKKELPAPDAEGNKPASPLDAEIKSMEEKRKELVKGGFKDRHFNWGSVLLALGVAIGVEGPVNTYMRTGKLFPGPHLYAGASIVVLWALAAAMVPQMQKGNDAARTAHIGLNMTNLALFAWQLPTGWDIVLKVFQFTKWP